MWMGRDKPPVNVRSRRWSRCPPPIVASTKFALRATWGVNGEKSCAPARSCSRRIRTSRLRTFGGPGNGDYRGELLRAIPVITNYATKLALPISSVLLRLDGLYGDAAPLIDVLTAGLGMIARSRDYTVLDLEVVTQVLAHAPDQVSIHPESGMTRALYDCPAVPLTPTGLKSASGGGRSYRHLLSSPSVGVERDGMVYELFVSTLPSPAFTSSDVLDLYLHRGSFETVLADEDGEQDSDRWCSHTPNGQECWQTLNQWVWNLRLELGQKLSSSELRTTEFAKASVIESAPTVEPAPPEKHTPPAKYGPPQWARLSFTGGFPGSAFIPQPDGTLRCPADRPLYPQERRPKRDGSLRVLYAARIGHCRSCLLRARCQESSSSLKPRRVSALFWPLESALSDASPPRENAPEPLPRAPVVWKDWPRCRIRRVWLKVVRSETVCLTSGTTSVTTPAPSPITTSTEEVLSRSQRAHWRLSWGQRLARNRRPSDALPLTITLHGLPATFAQSFGFDLLATA